MNYIFLTNQYLPSPGATGICIHQLAKTLVKEGNNVYTICYEDGNDISEYDGVKIVKIKIPLFLKSDKTVSNILSRYKYYFSVLSKLVHFFRYPLRSNKLVFEYMKSINNLLNFKDHFTIIASYTPLEAVVAAARIKKKYPELVRIVYYSADTLSNEQGNDGILPRNYRAKCGIRWEKYLFSIYDKILIMECHKNYYFSEIFKEFIEKMEIVNFPLLNKPSDEVLQEKFNILRFEAKSKFTFVYAGTLYRKLRNPQYLCDLLIELSHYIDLEVYFLGGGDCNDLINNANKNSNDKIKYLGICAHDKTLSYLYNANVLLSIGNVESPMMPSKIFEYMATGKPIIHVYTYDKDPCLDILKKYGNALLIKENEIDVLDKVMLFIKNMKELDYADVEKLFVSSKPEFTTNILENF